MSIDISDLAEYGPAVAEYRAAKASATENGDELAQMRVEQAWTNTKMELMQRKVAANESQRTLDEAKAKAKADFPNAPEELWGHLTDPAQVLAAAQAVHDRLTPPAPPQAPTEPQGSWGGAPPAAANTAGQDDPNVLRTPEDVDRRVASLMPDVLSKGKLAQAANDEVAMLRLDPILSRYEQGKGAR